MDNKLMKDFLGKTKYLFNNANSKSPAKHFTCHYLYIQYMHNTITAPPIDRKSNS